MRSRPPHGKPVRARTVVAIWVGSIAGVFVCALLMLGAPEFLIPIYFFGIIASTTAWLATTVYAAVRLVTGVLAKP